MKVLKLLLHLISHAVVLNHINTKLRVKLDCHCLKSSQSNIYGQTSGEYVY